MEKNAYQILGISPQADSKEIKKAYRKLAKRYHPDTNPNNKQAEIRFKEVTDAYDVLINEKKRAAYDQGRTDSATAENVQPKRSKTNSNTYNRNQGNMKEDLESQFEHFFGYNPKTKEKVDLHKEGKNPMDTSNLFGSFFGMGKK